jgi:hypothetical protein
MEGDDMRADARNGPPGIFLTGMTAINPRFFLMINMLSDYPKGRGRGEAR